MSFDIWLTYLVATCILSISPGAGAVNTMSNSVRFGVKRSLPAIIGLQAGLAADVLLVGVGLGALIASSVTAFSILKWIGAAYLVYLGYRKWKDSGALDVGAEGPAQLSAARMFYQATLVNLTNPKSIVFLVALFPQFIDPHLPKLPQFVILGSTMIAVDSLVMFGYASLARSLRHLVRDRRHMRMQNRIFGGMFVGAGVLLALVES